MSGRQHQTFRGSGLTVRNKQTKIWFFIAYLGLLVNLGPSLHHADFFGFHSHSHSRLGCCCCHAHPPAENRDHASDSTNESSSPHFRLADHDCAFCKFFDQYHVIAGSGDTPQRSTFAKFFTVERLADARSASLVPVARGPPVAGA